VPRSPKPQLSIKRKKVKWKKRLKKKRKEGGNRRERRQLVSVILGVFRSGISAYTPATSRLQCPGVLFHIIETTDRRRGGGRESPAASGRRRRAQIDKGKRNKGMESVRER